jgi:hypothetical protein
VEESFGLAIKEHLELKRRNSALETEMPLEDYRERSERSPGGGTQVLENTEEWVLPEARTVIGHEQSARAQVSAQVADELWTGTPAFDWGD